jgi:hypothetical protein
MISSLGAEETQQGSGRRTSVNALGALYLKRLP